MIVGGALLHKRSERPLRGPRLSCLPTLLLLACLFAASLDARAGVAAQDVPIPPAPDQWVTDTAGFLSPQDVARLNETLRAYELATQHQLLVWIGRTTGQVPIEDWANLAFEKWKVGRKGVDDGLILFIMSEDRRLRFEVGYGLEPDVPDLLASRIIEQIIVPRIRSGDNAGAIAAGMEAVAEAIGKPLPEGAAVPARTAAPQPRPIGLGQLILYGILGLIALVIFATNPSLATWLLISFLSSGNRRGGGWGGGGGRGGWGGGGGGFSGGGGMSGGGGASGRW